MRLRYELASLLVGFDIERVREQRDRAVAILSRMDPNGDPRGATEALNEFLDTLPIGLESDAVARFGGVP